MKRLVRAAVFVLATPGLAGCLVAETRHTLYLSPDGSVVWSVLERNIQSDESDGPKRRSEEQRFLEDLGADRHPIALGLSQLAAQSASARLLRRERPYTVLTEASFPRIDVLIQRFFEELRLPGDASLVWRGDRAELTATLDLARLDEEQPRDDTPVTHLLDDLERYEIVLTDGRFVGADGFELFENGARATLTPGETKDGRVAVRLAWIRN